MSVESTDVLARTRCGKMDSLPRSRKVLEKWGEKISCVGEKKKEHKTENISESPSMFYIPHIEIYFRKAGDTKYGICVKLHVIILLNEFLHKKLGMQSKSRTDNWVNFLSLVFHYSLEKSFKQLATLCLNCIWTVKGNLEWFMMGSPWISNVSSVW